MAVERPRVGPARLRALRRPKTWTFKVFFSRPSLSFRTGFGRGSLILSPSARSDGGGTVPATHQANRDGDDAEARQPRALATSLNVRMALRSPRPEKWVVKFALLASTLLRRELAANHLRVP